MIGVRLQPEQLAALDAWIGQQDPQPSRPEAIRKLIDKGIGESLNGPVGVGQSVETQQFGAGIVKAISGPLSGDHWVLTVRFPDGTDRHVLDTMLA